ncbi:MAG TPA: ABC transporter permease [Candidatus Poseidoniales archaeon]|jgi:sodium transport system permease protein|nr:MAG: hypothetical protein CXT69_02955 [Euryarchaeota archaeon]HIG04005.1 ABC transporter permease [Candidatus Poseidoniales archaeon]HIK79025.1 ABC transporter permease [Candidatus Poseidoniales archaeon]
MKMSKLKGRMFRVRAVATKELIDFVRDWRTLIAVILIPLIIFPLLFIALPFLLESQAEERSEFELRIVVQSESEDTDFMAYLDGDNANITWEELPAGIANLSDPGPDYSRVREHGVNAILRLEEGVEDNSTIWNYSILRDSTDEMANEATKRIVTALNTWEEQLIEATLDENDLNPNTTLNPIRWGGDIDASDVATAGEQAGFALSLFIPLIVATWTATSAMQPSIDMTAGERERGTMEALLCAPINRFELLLGKWIAVALISATGVLAQVCALFFAISFIASNSDTFGVPELSLSAILLMFMAILLFAIMVVAFQLALAVRSRSTKEAGSTLGPMIIAILFPAMFAQFINLEGVEGYWFLIPVVNVLLALREILTNTIIFEHIILWAGSSLIYALLAAYYASRQFNREDLVDSIN